MASSPITSWEIEEETAETMSDFIFWGSKITPDGECSHEIKRRLLLGRNAVTNLAAAARSLQLYLILCNPIDGSPPGSSVPGFSRQAYWSGLPFPSPMYAATAAAAAAKSLQLCPTLCDPIDSSPPGFPIPGILQARTLEWVAISFSNA